MAAGSGRLGEANWRSTARGGKVGAPKPLEVRVGERKQSKDGWAERRREKKRLKQERTGDSPEKRAEPQRKSSVGGPEGSADRVLGVGGGGIP